jgi:hypothetical protein
MAALSLGLALLSSCAIIYKKALDTAHWNEERFTLSRYELAFRVPGGRSIEVPTPPPIRSVDLQTDFADARTTIVLYKHEWDYTGFFWGDVLGGFGMTVAASQTTFARIFYL